MAATTEAASAWSEARQGTALRRGGVSLPFAKTRARWLAAARFTFLDIEARLAAAGGEWKRATDLRRQTLRLATEQNA
jgi:hypothetical protein